MAINLDPWLADTTQTEGRYSFNQWVLDGSHVNFGINFQGVAPGYLSRDHVKYYINDENGLIVVAATVVPSTAWQSDSVIQIMDGSNPYPAGYTLSIYRDSPKDQPIPNFEDGSIMDEENLDEGFRQAVYVAAEMVDRFGVSQDQSQDAIDKANEAINTANAATATANTALSTANTASSNASAAVTTANAAQTAAAAAVTTANGIDAKATAALNNSATAVSTANAASATANAIDGKAQTALDNSAAAVTAAGNAVDTVGTANSTANTALSTANGIAGTANTALTNANAALTAAVASAACNCRLVYTSATQVTLQRYNGSNIVLNGQVYTIPAAGVTLSNSSLAASTSYYIVAKYVASAIVLSAVAVSGASVSTDTSGLPVLSTDATARVVGMVYTTANTPGQFIDTFAVRGVATYFNRRTRYAQASGQASINSATNGFYGSAVSMLKWADDTLRITCAGSGTRTLAGNTQMGAYLNGTGAPSAAGCVVYHAAVSASVALFDQGTSEGYSTDLLMTGQVGMQNGGGATSVINWSIICQAQI